MAKRANQLICTGLERVCEALEDRRWSSTTKQQFWDYVNQALQIAKPTHTLFQLTLWYDQIIQNDQNQDIRVNLLILNFELREGIDDPDPYTGQCAFQLDAGGHVSSLVVCYDEV